MPDYPKDWGERRLKVLKRDYYTCTRCKAKKVKFHVHHILSLSQGGSNKLENLTTLCHKCHEKIHPHMTFNKIIRWMFVIGIILIFLGLFVSLVILFLGVFVFFTAFIFKILQIKFFVARKRFRKFKRKG